MEELLNQYFDAWLTKKISVLETVFSENIVYTECYGPQYHGLEQVLQWFKDWNEKGTVLDWTIKSTITSDHTIMAEWFFQCQYEGNVDEFDGVTIAEFNSEMKICNLKEFQSKSQHYFPYDKS